MRSTGRHGQIHPECLNTPRLIANDQQQAVWKWEQQELFGNTPPDENPSGLGVFENNLRYPGQYFDKETGLFGEFFERDEFNLLLSLLRKRLSRLTNSRLALAGR